MTEVRFQLGSGTDLPVSADLPVEIRKPNMALIARTLSSDSVELAPGTYFVSARLPAGQEISQQVQISGAEEALSVELTPEPKAEAGTEILQQEASIANAGGMSNRVWELRADLERAMESMRSERVEARLRLVTGNVLGHRCEVSRRWPWSSVPAQEGVARLEVWGRDAPLFAQVLQPDLPPFNIALPAGPEGGCVLILARLPESTIATDVQLEHTQADLLLRYREEGLLREAEVAIHSRSLDAEELLRQKRGDPIAAAVGAYSLLRWGEHERLHDWTENLRAWFPWFPDGAAIRGEHLARLGRHEEALATFLELRERGLPLFSGGVSYAVDRLRLYVSHGETTFGQYHLSPARDTLDRLQQFIPYIDFGRLVTTFTGLDPSMPDDEPLRDFRLIDDGLDIGQLFL